MITQKDMFVICRSALFEGYSPFTLAATLETLGARHREFSPGEVVTDESRNDGCLGLVVEGHLHVYDSAFKGRRHLIRIVSAGQQFGATFVATRRAEIPAMVTSHAKSVVVLFSLPCIRMAQKAGREAQFFSNLSAVIGEELIASWRKISILSCSNVAERVMLYLRMRSEREGSKTFAIGATGAEFADYLGVNRTALARVLRQLVKEGRFTYKRDVFTLA